MSILLLERQARIRIPSYLYLHRNATDIERVLQWIEATLSGGGIEIPLNRIDGKPFGMVSRFLSSEGTSSAVGCWRKKILAGIVPEIRDSFDEAFGLKKPLELDNVVPVSDVSDGLILTAAALWSLFDNSLERLPGCLCTFRSEGGDHIVCRQKREQGGIEWLLWHVPSEGDPLCNGENCQSNLAVALSDEEQGQRLFTVSPCILAWNAETRASATRPIAAEMSVSREFIKRKVIKRQVESYQVQGALSAPFPLTPQILGGITFSKKRYLVANSIDRDSDLALGRAAAAIVLVYCERSGIHLLTSGAEVIDILCLHLLRDTSYNQDIPPAFETGSAESRLQEWKSQNFQTIAQLLIPGQRLVREATRSVSTLLDVTKTIVASNGGAPVYWSLESLLQFAQDEALLPPKHHNHVSWHKLAAACPPLILAVGKVEPRLLNQATGSLTWKESAKKKAKPFTLFSSKPRPSGSLGAIVGSKRMMESWISRAASTSFRGSLEVTGDTVCAQHGAIAGEETFKVVKVTGHGTAIQEDLFLSCATCNPTPATQGNGSTQNGVADQSVQCLHYIQ